MSGVEVGDGEGRDELQQPPHQRDVDVPDDLDVHEVAGPVGADHVQEVPGHEHDRRREREAAISAAELHKVAFPSHPVVDLVIMSGKSVSFSLFEDGSRAVSHEKPPSQCPERTIALTGLVGKRGYVVSRDQCVAQQCCRNSGQERRKSSTASARRDSLPVAGIPSLVKMVDTYFSAARWVITMASEMPALDAPCAITPTTPPSR